MRKPAGPSGLAPRGVVARRPACVRLRVMVFWALVCLLAAWQSVRAETADVPEPPQSLADSPSATIETLKEAGTGIDYEVEITGSAHGALRTLLEASSQLIALADKPPASLVGLERRAVGDVDRFRTALRSEGYYDSVVDYDIDTSASPAKVILDVERGSPYQLTAFEISYTGDPPDKELPRDPADLGIELHRRARGPAIVGAEANLVRLLSERGYPYPEIQERRVYIDRDAHTLAATLSVDAGPQAVFGVLEVEGLVDVQEHYIRLVRPWIRGQLYDRRLLDRYRRDLVETNLFTAIAIEPSGPPNAAGSVPIRLTVTEKDHRTLGGGLSWGTDEGFTVSGFWEHRNLFGADETFRFETDVGEIEQQVRGLFAKPRYLRNDQTLLADVTWRREDTDAFKEISLSSAVGLEREFSEIWEGKLGVSAELSRITENRDKRTLWILGLPGSIVRDTRDDSFNAARGTRFEVGVTPYITTGDDQLLFTVSRVAGNAYLSLHPEDRIVLAGSARLGSILGQSRADIPASKRFYAGGGGSIRGYEFQKVGPLDDEGDPLGGRSLVELSGELRLRFGERLGVVPFVDGGTVFTDPDFTSSEEDAMRWAVGLGFRYFTVVGPIRLDVAFPLDERNDEDPFQFYISIGQSF